MAMNDETLKTLVEYLNATLHYDASVRKPAERYLESFENNQGYSLLLLVAIESQQLPDAIRVAAAITFKNFVKRNWAVIEGEESRVPETDRDAVRARIIGLLLEAPDSVQKQLSEAISLIGRQDFPYKWPQLLPTLTAELSGNDMKRVTSCLRTAHALFKRYRHEMKSDQLWMEIKLVLDQFAAPLTELFRKLLEMAGPAAQSATADQLKYPFKSLVLVTKVFQSLNAQDLPEFFEDNMGIWMPGFLELLRLELPSLASDSEDEPGPMEQLKSSICDNVTMYAQKYDEEFHQYLEPFVGVVWNLLVNTGAQAKYDLLVSNAMNFLASVCERHQYKALFEQEGALRMICESVIVKNMIFRESDQEMFEDNPEEFARRDLEGSDVDTRRRSAADFVRGLCRFFESQVMAIFGTHIQQLLAEYSANPSGEWVKKDAVYCLVGALAKRGETAQFGATKTSELVDLNDFYAKHVRPELLDSDVNRAPVLKAGALKYVVSFRGHLPSASIVEAANASVILLTAESVVVRNYAAHTMERLFMLKQNNAAVLTADHFDAGMVMTNLFAALEKTGTEESEYIMKAVMRSLTALVSKCAPFASQITLALTSKISKAAQNPSKPHYNHFMFESLCVLVKKVGPTAGVAQFEEACFPPFQEILQKDVVEFMPYAFQIMGMLLDMRPEHSGVPDAYNALLPFLLAPVLWERSGNVPALVRLLQAYFRVGGDAVAATHLSAVLGVFQKLIASKLNDHYGFYLLNSIIEHVSYEKLSGQIITAILTVLFKRLMTARTVKFAKGLIIFCCLFVIKRGSATLVQELEKLQGGMFKMVIEKVFLRDVQKISDSHEKKICCVGIANLLADAVDNLGQELWPQLMTALVKLFELPEENDDDDDQFLDIEATSGYANAYSQLAFASRNDVDPTGVSDVKGHLVKCLSKVSASRPGVLPQLINPLEQEVKQFITSYASAAGITLA
uniref:Exportin-2 n=1 Tax=Plectus sambesii TaxID=2011161 RepID=A0A914URF2_9BILA